jgi:hypothetical protein
VSKVVPIGLDELPDAVPLDIRNIIEHGDDPERPIGSETPHFPSRSEAVFFVCCQLAKVGCSDEIVAGVISNPALAISVSVREKRNSVRYALKQAKAARASVQSGWPDCNSKGRPRPSMHNAMVALRRSGLTMTYDVFRYRKTVEGHAIQIKGRANGAVVQVPSSFLLAVRLGVPLDRQTPAHAKRLAFVMRKLGWKPTKFRFNGHIVRGYEREKPCNHIDDVEYKITG